VKKLSTAALLLGVLTISVWGDFTWPDQQANVRINGEAVVATWKDGIPYVSREQTLHLLHIRSGPPEINLIDALTQRGHLNTPRSAKPMPTDWGMR
jgi:hypothetical protein